MLYMHRTVIDQAHATDDGTGIILLKSIGKFLLMFGCSALIGTVSAIISALVRPIIYMTICVQMFAIPVD